MPERTIRCIGTGCGMTALIAAAAIRSVAADGTGSAALEAGALPALTVQAGVARRVWTALLLGDARFALAMLEVIAGVCLEIVAVGALLLDLISARYAHLQACRPSEPLRPALASDANAGEDH